MTTLSLAALLGASVPAFAVSPGTFDPRDPNSLTKPGQSAQKPYALTGSAQHVRKQANDSRVQVNSPLGARAVITTHDDKK